MSRGDDVVPIPGTKRRKYLEENIGALDVRLGKEDLAEIEAVFPRSAVSGARYAAGTVGQRAQDQERRPG
jgi:aryl-alcohol dehydrogenase-like predicted oxidoreductase